MQKRLRPVEVALPEYGVFVLESHHAAGFRMPASRHDFLEIFYVLHGAGTFLLDGRSCPCRADDVIVVPAGTVHHIADARAAPMSLYGVCVAPSVYGLEPDFGRVLPAGRLPLTDLTVPQVRAGLRQLLYEQTLARPGRRLWLVGLTLQLLGLLVRGHASLPRSGPGGSPNADHLLAVRQYVAELPQRFFEPDDLDHTAARLGMSRRRFTQLFRSVTGTSWLDHLTSLRVDYACRLLRETRRDIVAVAFECGYEELSSFYRAFKRRTGLPPSEWRRQEEGDGAG